MKFTFTLLVTLFALALNAKDTERIEAILLTGDGASFQSAYKVQSISEQYGMLTYLGKKPNMHMLIVYNNEAYDVFTDSVTGEKIHFKIVGSVTRSSAERGKPCF